MIEQTGTEIATAVLMERQVDPRLVLIVEGPEECQLIDIHLRDDLARTIPAGSKTAVLIAIGELASRGAEWVVGVVDADFDRLTGAADGYPEGVIASESYDLTIDIFRSRPAVIRNILIASSKPGAISSFEKSHNVETLHIVKGAMRAVGCLRFAVSVESSLVLSVRSWNFDGLATAALKGEVLDAVASKASQRSGGRHTVEEIAGVLDQLSQRFPEPSPEMFNGHDLHAMLAETIAVAGYGRMGQRDVASSLRSTLACDVFQALAVVRQLNEWGRAQVGETLWRCGLAAA